MVVTKRQRKGKACENGTKENPRTGVRTSGERNSPPGQPNLYRAGSGGRRKNDIKRKGDKIELEASLLFTFFELACPHASRMYFPLLVK